MHGANLALAYDSAVLNKAPLPYQLQAAPGRAVILSAVATAPDTIVVTMQDIQNCFYVRLEKSVAGGAFTDVRYNGVDGLGGIAPVTIDDATPATAYSFRATGLGIALSGPTSAVVSCTTPPDVAPGPPTTA
jgi:hypothetical protein